MGVAMVRGIQSSLKGGPDHGDGEPLHAAACMKHFFGYSHPQTGHDRTPSMIPERELLEMYLPPFRAAVEAGVLSAMESYNELDGVPLASSRRYLVDLLRGELGFRGMLVTDYGEINNLDTWHKVADGQVKATEMVMQDTSIDMSMVPMQAGFSEALQELVRTGRVSLDRVNMSVRRVLSLKEDLGLLDSPVPELDSPLLGKVGSTGDRELALQAARESLTLLLNKGDSLPVDKWVFFLLLCPPFFPFFVWVQEYAVWYHHVFYFSPPFSPFFCTGAGACSMGTTSCFTLQEAGRFFFFFHA
ncbi:unnamed protein product [Discosporangium mesarthrocarpum]